jgi:hypothetical protein
MRLRSSGATAVVLLAAGALACGDRSPTESRPETVTVRFALSTESAQAFDLAIDDVRERVLPALTAAAAPELMAGLLDEMSSSIAARDQHALRRVLTRVERTLAGLAVDDETAAAIDVELDAIRLILEEARPLATGAPAAAR